eukprot:COSAG06_NODE_25272_length_641_cov_0.688192_1_plen_85_part_10
MVALPSVLSRACLGFSSEADAPQKRERECVFRTRLEIVELIVHDSRSACHHPVAVGDLVGIHRLRCSQSRDKAGRQAGRQSGRQA